MSGPPLSGNVRVNGARLWQSLMEMAQIGATEKGGCCRLALTDLDRQGRDLFVRWARDAGCSVAVDAMGNVFARRPGRNPELPPVMTGSHLDTQPTGGRFDGVYGVLAGLEVIRTLNDHGVETDAPVEVSVWTNEEGSRFAPAMVSSGVFAGVFDQAYAYSRLDRNGISLGEALEEIGYRGDRPASGQAVGAFFEAHIEQGPVLEAEGKTIGVVTGAQGQRWYELTLTGRKSHAGTTPMSHRRDALLGAARVTELVHQTAMSHAPDAVGTVGLMEVSPNSRNTIPGQVFMTLDLRHPRDDSLAAMGEAIRVGVTDIAAGLNLQAALEEIWYSPPVAFAPSCIAAVEQAVDRLGYDARPIISGAGHDACYINRIAPTAMIFIPCENGISHNEIESALPQDVEAGANVLLLAMIEAASDGPQQSDSVI